MSWLRKHVDCIVYINLDERKDRKKLCEAILDSVDISPYYRVPAIKDHILGSRGCTLSHYNIIKHAKENNYRNILIFEDDFTITNAPTFKSNLLATFQQIKSNNTIPDMLYLGGNLATGYTENHKKIDNNLYKIGGAKTTHSYIIYNKLFDVILKKYDNINFNDNSIWSGQNRINIDYYYLSEIHHMNYNIFGCYPCLTDQSDGYSDIEHKVVNYNLAKHWNLVLEKIN